MAVQTIRVPDRYAPILDVAEAPESGSCSQLSALAVTCAMEQKDLFTLDFLAEVEPTPRKPGLFSAKKFPA